MKLTALEVTTKGGHTRLTGKFESSGGAALPDIWFECPQEYASFVRADADVFLPLMVTAAMLRGETFETDLPVSAELVEGAAEVQDIFATWFPDRMKRFTFAFPNVVRKAEGQAKGVGTFFSGGVDSFYTVLKERLGIPCTGAYPTHFIHVYGLENALHTITSGRDAVMREAAGKLNVPYLLVSTNFRDVHNYTFGPNVAGPGMAGVGLFLSEGLSRVLIPASSTYAYEELRPWSTHPMVDRLWSTEYMKVRMDGCEVTRAHKVEQIVKEEVALEYLCCCWYTKGAFVNCGKCSKCLRTMMTLKALGVLEKVRTFPHEFPYERVRRVEGFRIPFELPLLAENLELARRTGKDPRLTKVIERQIRFIERREAAWKLIRGTPVEPIANLASKVLKRFRKAGE